jgi:transcription elongation GreA/GreB family factor
MTFKKKVFDRYMSLLDDKIRSLENILRELEEGAQNDNKSSAGDKHETARAMMQLEQEKISKQLAEAILQRAALEKLGNTSGRVIKPGSLIRTNKGVLYLGISPAKIYTEEINVFVMSSLSPLGQKLLGLKAGDKAEMNGSIYEIESVE